jgi:acetolactate synthase I/II/III large subunit
MRMHGGEALVEMLKAHAVELMFGLPGDQTHIYDAIARNSKIRHILVRHEECAALMADAYARVTGKVGVCDATVGPGATNLISGIGESFTSGLPVVAIVSDIRSDWRGRGCLQEVDQVGVFKPITKAAITIDHASRVPEIVRRAFQIATTGKPGPVLVNCPLDALKGEAEFAPEAFRVDARYGEFPPHRSLPSSAEIDAALSRLLSAKRPVILCGGGVMSSRAWKELLALAEMLEIPVATTFMGKGSIPENHSLALGPFGLLGRPVANEWVLNADVVLALGTRFTNVDTAGWRIPKPGSSIIQVDLDPTELGRNYPVSIGLAGDVRAVLSEFLSRLEARPDKRKFGMRAEAEGIRRKWLSERGPDNELARSTKASPVHPLQAIRALRRSMRPEDVIICDSGFNQIWGGQYFEVHRAGRAYLGPRGFGVMGYSFPAAIAVKLADPSRRVVALCGDGGFSMVLQELETALRVDAPVVVCVLNNRNLEYVKQNQRMLYDSRFLSSDHLDTNFADVAKAFGCYGRRVESSGELEAALGEALDCGKPAVVDVRTVESAEPDRLSLQKLSGGSLYPTG